MQATLFNEQYCKVKRSLQPDYESMSVWELTTRHILASEKQDFDTCMAIEAIISTRPELDKYIASKRAAYNPVGIVKVA